MEIRIYVSCHKRCHVLKSDLLYPVQVGTANAPERYEGMLYDDEGKNISDKNQRYCELTAQYWAWKNQDADYYGFFHYRRYMSFAEEEFAHTAFEDVELERLDDGVADKLCIHRDRVEELLGEYPVIATSETELKNLHKSYKSNYYFYALTQHIEDLDLVLEILHKQHPEYDEVAQEYIHGSKGYYCNMFIMRKDIFQKYCEWLFPILEEHERRRDISAYNTQDYRVSGYLAERLFGIYYTMLKRNGIKCKEVQRTLFLNVEQRSELKPYAEENNIVIAMAANDRFAPYVSVVVQSILEHSQDGFYYDILVMSQDMSDINIKCLRNQVSAWKNACIRFLDPTPYIDTSRLFVREHFSQETYYRLVLPEILPYYDKVLYLDADLIVEADVAELYQMDLGDCLVGASKDADTAGLYNGYEKKKKKYMDEILRIEKPYDYFQAGVMLFNLRELRRTYTIHDILDFAHSYPWELLDQDILNYLCQGRVAYFGMEWNMMVDSRGIRIRNIISRAPCGLSEMYHCARKTPKIIHYAGPEKPWNEPEMDQGLSFWKYAQKSVYYETILSRMQQYKIEKWEKEHPKGWGKIRNRSNAIKNTVEKKLLRWQEKWRERSIPR